MVWYKWFTYHSTWDINFRSAYSLLYRGSFRALVGLGAGVSAGVGAGVSAGVGTGVEAVLFKFLLNPFDLFSFFILFPSLSSIGLEGFLDFCVLSFTLSDLFWGLATGFEDLVFWTFLALLGLFL